MSEFLKSFILVLLISGMGAGLADAQATDRSHAAMGGAIVSASSALPEEARILKELRERSANRQQAPVGNGNFASITQSGSFNKSTISQTGSANIAETRILNGSYNETMQIQTGSRNVSRVEIASGRNNKARTEQTGDDNTIDLVLRDAENTRVEYTQTGNGLNGAQAPIIIDRSGSSPMPIIIHQSN